MTSRSWDLGTRGRVLVAAVAVGSAGVLSGWMAATDHASTTASDATSGSSVSASTSSGSAAASSQPDFDDSTALPGTAQSPTAVPDARTGGS